MNAWYHARACVKKWGGAPEDYQPIHDFLDSTKSAMPDVRHRAILHNAFGIFLVEKVFGPTITNSDGRYVPVREIAEQHIIQDLGFIPTVQDWLENMPMRSVPWAGGHVNLLKRKGVSVKRKIVDKCQKTQEKSAQETSL